MKIFENNFYVEVIFKINFIFFNKSDLFIKVFDVFLLCYFLKIVSVFCFLMEYIFYGKVVLLDEKVIVENIV